jgi:hypothetical protein
MFSIKVHKSITAIWSTTNYVVVMEVVFVWIVWTTTPGENIVLIFVDSNVLEVGWILQVPKLSIDLFDCISNSYNGTSCSWHISLHIDQGLLLVDSHNFLIEDCCTHVTKMTCHLLSFENFTWELTHTNGTRQSMGLRVTMRSFLTTEVPSLHYTLVTLTLAC